MLPCEHNLTVQFSRQDLGPRRNVLHYEAQSYLGGGKLCLFCGWFPNIDMRFSEHSESLFERKCPLVLSCLYLPVCQHGKSRKQLGGSWELKKCVGFGVRTPVVTKNSFICDI
jgi:hypothetical protein